VLVTGLLMCFLLFVIVYLLSVLHSKKFYLVPEGNTLTVQRGNPVRFRNTKYQPADPAKASLYAPVEIPGACR